MSVPFGFLPNTSLCLCACRIPASPARSGCVYGICPLGVEQPDRPPIDVSIEVSTFCVAATGLFVQWDSGSDCTDEKVAGVAAAAMRRERQLAPLLLLRPAAPLTDRCVA